MELRASPALLLCGILISVTGCPDGFVPYHEGYCYLVSESIPWDAGADNCRDMGGELASIHSALENQRIAAALNASGHFNPIYIGLRCAAIPVWMDGTPVNYRNFPHAVCWQVDEVFTTFTINTIGVWTVFMWKFNNKETLCRHRQRNGERCSDYDEVGGTGTCISIRTDSRTWWGAENKCQEEGGHLLSIHDQKMNNHIAERIRNPEIVGTNGAFLIGMQSQATQKGESLTWSDGSDVNYTNFDKGYPADILGQCTAMETAPGGKWISTQCETSSLPYICSRPVNEPIQAAGCPLNPNFKDSGTIMSPSYPSSSGPLTCEYYLSVPLGQKINLVIVDLNTNLCCDQLKLYDGIDTATPFVILSGKANQTSYTTPTSNVLKMMYTSTDGTFVRGWKVSFKGV